MNMIDGYMMNQTVERLKKVETMLSILNTSFDRTLKKRDLSTTEELRLINTALSYFLEVREDLALRGKGLLEKIKQ